jgi:hypothetical protein
MLVVSLFVDASSRHLPAGHQIVDVLGDVGGVVADALDVLGAEQKMGAGP